MFIAALYIYVYIHIRIHTMEYYLTIKRNEIELFVVGWMDLASVIQSEISQKEKNEYHILSHIHTPLKKNGSEDPRGRTGIKLQT